MCMRIVSLHPVAPSHWAAHSALGLTGGFLASLTTSITLASSRLVGYSMILLLLVCPLSLLLAEQTLAALPHAAQLRNTRLQPAAESNIALHTILHQLQDSNIIRGRQCQCTDRSLCDNIKTQHPKEVFGFIWPASKYFHRYNWTRLTTVAWLEDPELVCIAHAHDARVVMNALGISEALASYTARVAWVAAAVRRVLELSLDGINFDYEADMAPDAPERSAYTELVSLTRHALHTVLPGSQVSVDVPWSPYDVDGRNYDWNGLANAADLLFVMSYDMQSQIWGRCIASANAPTPQMLRGLKQWLQLGTPPNKLVLGLPWYGYDYPCGDGMSGTAADPQLDVCLLHPVPFKGALCSDAAGAQVPYSNISAWLRQGLNTTVVCRDEQQASPFFNYKAQDGTIHQVWFDDPQSLRSKYAEAAKLGLRGVGFWNLEWVYSTPSWDSDTKADADAMWQAVESGFFSQTTADAPAPAI